MWDENLSPLRNGRIYLAINPSSTGDLHKLHSDTGSPGTINKYLVYDKCKSTEVYNNTTR